ncbi:MAG: TlpA family protein disulfide reductase [Deltaproteobacteria bacterium]|nr:TlpA family protein disulfide reductase [Deltaproteobacteria bacterium]
MTDRSLQILKSNRLSGRQLGILALIAAVFGVLMIFYVTGIGEGLQHFSKAQLQIVAPDFEANASEAKRVPNFVLEDTQRKKVKLSQFDAIDVLVVNIWSAGCPVCREEIPSLTELDRRLSQINGVTLLTIAVADGFDEVASYFPRGTNLRILFDKDDSIAGGVFGTDKYPETFILDKDRRIRARFDGARDWHGDAFISYVESFL